MMSEQPKAPKLDYSKLKEAELKFVKLVEKQNFERVQKLKAIRKRNLITAGAVGAAVLGIYGYTLFAVHQESFLDDFDEPAKTVQ